MEFQHLFLRPQFPVKPVGVSWNVHCFLKLAWRQRALEWLYHWGPANKDTNIHSHHRGSKNSPHTLNKLSTYMLTESIFLSTVVPGDGGSRLEAHIHKPSVPHYWCEKTSSSWFDLWLSVESLLPEAIDCWADNIRCNFVIVILIFLTLSVIKKNWTKNIVKIYEVIANHYIWQVQ